MGLGAVSPASSLSKCVHTKRHNAPIAPNNGRIVSKEIEMLKENTVSRRGFIATGASALLMLTGCNGNTSNAAKAPTQTVSITIGNTNKVLLDIPKS